MPVYSLSGLVLVVAGCIAMAMLLLLGHLLAF